MAARDFFIIRGELSLHDGLLVRGDRIVVPFRLRKQILERIHEGHMGVAKCRERAAQSVWRPRIGKDIKSRVASCRHCLEKQPSQASEPFLPSALPDRPFQKVGIDICEFRNKHYLVQVDYYSGYIDVNYLPSLTSATVIGKLKNFFSHHGVPETVVSDNGTQFTSAGRVPYFCRSVELQPCHQQPPLSSKQWCCRASGEDRQRDPQIGRHLPCPFVLLLNPHSRPC